MAIAQAQSANVLAVVERLTQLGILGFVDSETLRFFHSTTRDAVLESMLLAQRSQIHGAIIGHYEGGHHGHRIPVAALGEHYAETVVCQAETRVPDPKTVARALELLSSAVEEAKWAGSAMTVSTVLERQLSVVDAVEKAGDHSEVAREQLFDVLSQLGASYCALEGPASLRATELFDRGLKISEELPDVSLEKKAPALAGMWYTECINMKWDESCAFAENILDLGKSLGSVPIQLVGLEFILCCKGNQAMWGETDGYSRQLRELAAAHRGATKEAFGIMMLWPPGMGDYIDLMSFFHSGRIAEGNRLCDALTDFDAYYACEGEWEGLPMPVFALHGLSYLCVGYFVSDQPERFRRDYEKVLAHGNPMLCSCFGADVAAVKPLGFLGLACFLATQYYQLTGAIPFADGLTEERCLALLREGSAALSAKSPVDGAIGAQYAVAAELHCGNFDEASELLEQPFAVEYGPTQAMHLFHRGVVAENSGDEAGRAKKAKRLYERSLNHAMEAHDMYAVRALHALAKLAKANEMDADFESALERLHAFRDGGVAGYDFDDEYKATTLARYLRDLE
jgi:hypothetical protein